MKLNLANKPMMKNRIKGFDTVNKNPVPKSRQYVAVACEAGLRERDGLLRNRYMPYIIKTIEPTICNAD